MSPYLYICLHPCLHVLVQVSMSSSIYPCPRPCFHVLVYVSMFLSIFPCPCPCFHVLIHVAMSSSMFPHPSPCFYVFSYVSISSSMFLCPHPCFHVFVHVFMSLFMFPCSCPCPNSEIFRLPRNSRNSLLWTAYCKRRTELTENTTSVCLLQGNGKLPFVSCTRKRKFSFLGRQTVNGNLRLLFQQTCPSMLRTTTTAFRAAVQQQSMEDLMASKTLATTVRPEREVPTVSVKPLSYWLVSAG